MFLLQHTWHCHAYVTMNMTIRTMQHGIRTIAKVAHVRLCYNEHDHLHRRTWPSPPLNMALRGSPGLSLLSWDLLGLPGVSRTLLVTPGLSKSLLGSVESWFLFHFSRSGSINALPGGFCGVSDQWFPDRCSHAVAFNRFPEDWERYGFLIYFQIDFHTTQRSRNSLRDCVLFWNYDCQTVSIHSGAINQLLKWFCGASEFWFPHCSSSRSEASSLRLNFYSLRSKGWRSKFQFWRLRLVVEEKENKMEFFAVFLHSNVVGLSFGPHVISFTFNNMF